MATTTPNLDKAALEKVKSRVPGNSTPFEQGDDSDQYKFASFVYEYCKSLILSKDSKENGYTYFVYIPTESVRDVENKGTQVRQLRKLISHDLTGSLVLCLDTGLSNTRIVEVEGDGLDAWNNLANKFDDIEQLINTQLCHAILDFSSQQLSVYFSNLSCNNQATVLDLQKSQQTFSCEDLEEFSDQFHEEETKLPSCALVVWDNQTKFKLIAKTEERIVARYALNLTCILGRENVGRETQGAHGRSDLFIHSTAMEPEHGPCVMEFKVLRNSDGEKKCLERLNEGILQALDYGKDKQAKSHYLLAYDGRETLGKIVEIEDSAKESNVKYLHYNMYNTVDGERKDKL